MLRSAILYRCEADEPSTSPPGSSLTTCQSAIKGSQESLHSNRPTSMSLPSNS